MKNVITAFMIGLLCGVNLVGAEVAATGQKGGRLLEGDGFKAEFFIEQDRHASLGFYNDQMEKMSVTGQKASLIAVTPAGQRVIEFKEKAGDLYSKEPLPAGQGYNLVVSIRKDDQAKTKNFRMLFDTSLCGGCDKAEYACACEGH